jgi:hypothetical protein
MKKDCVRLQSRRATTAPAELASAERVILHYQLEGAAPADLV